MVEPEPISPQGKTESAAVGQGFNMADVERISPEEVYSKVKAGTALLVCGYEDDESFRKFHLEGAISFSDYTSRLPSLPKEQEVVFYCD
jgi:hypothetical protein